MALSNPASYRDYRGAFPLLVVLVVVALAAGAGIVAGTVAYRDAREAGASPFVSAVYGGIVGGGIAGSIACLVVCTAASGPMAALTMAAGKALPKPNLPVRPTTTSTGARNPKAYQAPGSADRLPNNLSVPKVWETRSAQNGKGTVWQAPGMQPNANSNSVRVMNPTPDYPNGYVRYYNEYGQAVNAAGKPGTHSGPDTHFQISPGGAVAKPLGWGEAGPR